MGAAALHAAVCDTLFGGAGTLAVRPLSKDELGIRLPGAEADRWLGTAYVGDAAKLATSLKAAGVQVEEADAITGSLFARLDERPEVRFLIGSRKFIEGWSSFRVSTLGLLKIGRGAGSQVIQLFGRGVRLAGVGGRLKRAAFVPEQGPHPTDLELGETLYVFGVQAEYVQTWLESLAREGMAAQSAVVPVAVTRDVAAMGLLVPGDDPARENEFGRVPVRFTASEQAPVRIDLTARMSVLAGVGDAQALQVGGDERPVRALLGRRASGESLFQHAQRFLRQQGLQQVWVTPVQAADWLDRARCVAPATGVSAEDHMRLGHELFAQWEAALLRTWRKARLSFLTQAPMLDALTPLRHRLRHAAADRADDGRQPCGGAAGLQPRRGRGHGGDVPQRCHGAGGGGAGAGHRRAAGAERTPPARAAGHRPADGGAEPVPVSSVARLPVALALLAFNTYPLWTALWARWSTSTGPSAGAARHAGDAAGPGAGAGRVRRRLGPGRGRPVGQHRRRRGLCAGRCRHLRPGPGADPARGRRRRRPPAHRADHGPGGPAGAAGVAWQGGPHLPMPPPAGWGWVR
jgi:hypothetical protein